MAGGGVAVPNGPENCLVPFCHPACQISVLLRVYPLPRESEYGSVRRTIRRSVTTTPARVWFRTCLGPLPVVKRKRRVDRKGQANPRDRLGKVRLTDGRKAGKMSRNWLYTARCIAKLRGEDPKGRRGYPTMSIAGVAPYPFPDESILKRGKVAIVY
jgi:hypothetical protein